MSNQGFRQRGDRDTPLGGTPPAAGPARPGGGGGLLARIGGSRNGAIIAAGGTVAAVAVLSMLRGKKSTAAASGDPTQVQPAGSGSFDSGPYDMWNAWQQQYEDLSGRVSSLENPPLPVTSTPVPPAVPGFAPPSPQPVPDRFLHSGRHVNPYTLKPRPLRPGQFGSGA